MRSLPRILIVEDEPAIAELIAVNLRHNGFQPIWALDGETAQKELDDVLPDVILLDWMLPKESGLSLAKKWRNDKRSEAIPILMLTARGDEADRVAGLDAGADDYIVKPFKPKELVARIRARVRRHDDVSNAHLAIGDLLIDVNAHTVTRAGLPLALTPLEFDLLVCLARKPWQVFTREVLLEQVWGYRHAADTRLVNVHVQRLRGQPAEVSGVFSGFGPQQYTWRPVALRRGWCSTASTVRSPNFVVAPACSRPGPARAL